MGAEEKSTLQLFEGSNGNSSSGSGDDGPDGSGSFVE